MLSSMLSGGGGAWTRREWNIEVSKVGKDTLMCVVVDGSCVLASGRAGAGVFKYALASFLSRWLWMSISGGGGEEKSAMNGFCVCVERRRRSLYGPQQLTNAHSIRYSYRTHT